MLRFVIRQMIGVIHTGFVVEVKAVHGGGTDAPPTVDVLPLVNQIDGQGNRTAHGTIYGLPVVRIQGGTGGIIADPVAGDVGYVLAADRDISAVKANVGKQSNPGSFRRYDMADAVYLGLVLKAGLVNYVQFTTSGLRIHGKDDNLIVLDGTGIAITDKNGNSIAMTSAGINLNGMIIDSSGNVTTPGSITSGSGGADSVTLQHHTHTGNGVPPTPGT